MTEHSTLKHKNSDCSQGSADPFKHHDLYCRSKTENAPRIHDLLQGCFFKNVILSLIFQNRLAK